MLIELLPCPFCGQKLDVNDIEVLHPLTRPDHDGKVLYRAGCVECYGGCGAEVTGWSSAEAIQRWNARTQ